MTDQTLALLNSLPGWFGAAILGLLLSGITALITQIRKEWVAAAELKAQRLSGLMRLDSHLRASAFLFGYQAKLRNRLTASLAGRVPQSPEEGFEDLISQAYLSQMLLPPDQTLHALIRSLTMELYVVNTEMLKWLSEDWTFKTGRWKDSRVKDAEAGALAQELLKLEQHLIAWLAKYRVWIPEHPEHAMVYMGDENMHGPAFPTSLEPLLAKTLDQLNSKSEALATTG